MRMWHAPIVLFFMHLSVQVSDDGRSRLFPLLLWIQSTFDVGVWVGAGVEFNDFSKRGFPSSSLIFTSTSGTRSSLANVFGQSHEATKFTAVRPASSCTLIYLWFFESARCFINFLNLPSLLYFVIVCFVSLYLFVHWVPSANTDFPTNPRFIFFSSS